MNRLLDFLKIIRFPNLVIIALTQYAIRFGIIYPFLKQANYSLFLSEKLFALLVLATVLIAAAGYIINDYFDVKLDYLNKPKDLIIGKSISRRQAMVLHAIINIAGLLIAAYIAIKINHPLLVLFQLVSAALLWFYSVSFKKQVLVGNLVIASLTALVPFTSGYYEVALMFDHLKEFEINQLHTNFFEDLSLLLFSIKYLLYWVIGYSFFAFILTFNREIIKDCEDIEGDKAFNCKTFPIVYGIPRAKKISLYLFILTGLFILSIAIMQFFSKDWISLVYFTLFLLIPIIWSARNTYLAKNKRHFFIISQSIKIIMLFGIIYTAIIYLF